jgi:tetratricopeptide (TPR) repeat protein
MAKVPFMRLKRMRYTADSLVDAITKSAMEDSSTHAQVLVNVSRAMRVRFAPFTRLTLPSGETLGELDLVLRAIGIDRMCCNAFCTLGEIASMEGLQEIAIPGIPTALTELQLYLKEIELCPTNGQAYIAIGMNLDSEDEQVEINKEFFNKQQLYLKAVEVDPTNGFAYYTLASRLAGAATLQINGESTTAKQLLLKALDLDPLFPATYLALDGMVATGEELHLLNGEVITKLDINTRILEIDPKSYGSYARVAELLAEGESVQLTSGTTLNKQQLYLRAIDVAPWYDATYRQLAATLPDEGSIELLNGETKTKEQLCKLAEDNV